MDAMSSIGCKQPLRHAIITNDEWFRMAKEMICYLQKYFNNLGDMSKEHCLIDEAETANKRRKKQEELVDVTILYM